MISERALQLIRSAKNIAIAIADETAGDQIGASIGLLNFFIAQGKKAELFFTERLPPQFSFLAPYIPEEEPAHPADSLRDFIISLDAKKLGVEEIRYEKNGDALSVILGSKQDIFPKDITIQSANDCDLVMSFGIPKRETVAAKAGTDAPRLAHAPMLLLSLDAAQPADANTIIADAALSSWCELVWSIIAAAGGERAIPETTATPLLAGLFAATKNLLPSNATAAPAQLASVLAQCGAKQELIREHLENKKMAPLNLMQLWGRALSRSRLDGAMGILWSFLPAEDFLKTGSTSQNMPFIFSQMEQIISPRTGFLYVFENPHKNHIRAILKSKNSSLLTRAAAEESGELSQEALTFHKSFASFTEAEEELRVLLEKIL